jgi:hypothetical protein
LVLNHQVYLNVKLNFFNATGATSGGGNAYPSREPEFTPGFQWSSCYSIFSFMCMFCRSLFVLLSFFFWPLTYRGHLWHIYSNSVNQVMVATVQHLKWWLSLSHEKPLVQKLPCWQPSIKEILIGTTSSGISYQLREIC